MEIYLIRHTTPEISKGICYGQSDISLADCFADEVDELRSLLPRGINKVYSSPLGRCTKLARTLFPVEDIVIDPRLMEINFGDWELKEWSIIDPTQLNSWMKDFITVRPSNGENLLELNERVRNFMSELQTIEEDKLVIITHAGVIRCIVSQILKIDLSNIFQINVDYGSVSKLKIDKELSSIEYLNKRGIRN